MSTVASDVAHRPQSEDLAAAMAFEPPELLLERFAHEYMVSALEAREGFEEVKKFLIVCKQRPGGGLSPSQRVDAMWHSFLLFTRDYMRLCDLLGGYIHHIPTRASGHGDIIPRKYAITLVALAATFGTINTHWWEDVIAIEGRQYPALLSVSGDPGEIAAAIAAMPPPSLAEIQAAANAFRQANGLVSADETHQWLAEMGLSRAAFQKLLQWGVQARKVHSRATTHRDA
jgi:hypothetical protein